MDKDLTSEGLSSKNTEGQGLANTDQQDISDSGLASIDDIVLFVKQLCLTFSKFSLYPHDHPVNQNQIATTWNELIPVFAKYGDFDLSCSEGKLLFFGMPVEEGNATVKKFVRHVESFHVKSIEFSRDLTFEEFAVFVAVFGQEPRMILEQGGTSALLKQHGISHINFNSAIYQVVRKDQKIVKEAEKEEDEKSKNIRKVNEVKPTTPNEEKAKNILVKYLESDGSLEAIQELLKSLNMDSETIKRVIQDLKRIMEETGLEAEELIKYLEHQIEQEIASAEDGETDLGPEKKKRKRVSKSFRPLADRIRDKLKTDFKDLKGKDRLIEYLDHIYNREINRVVEAKTAELQEQIERDKKTFFEIGEALEQTDIGVIVLDDFSKISFMEHAESLPIPLTIGEPLPPELIALIKTSREERKWKVEETRLGKIRFILFKV